ncbi:MAG: DUF4851 domain-containing protein [Desulfovibrionaceae bacterium]|nr:DUF4851 domain-containing protein [Desulfovibrionaceae bacterium]
MQGFFRFIRPLLAALVLAACTPARTGVIGNTLTTNVKPRISITGLAPLGLLSHGSQRFRAATDVTAITAAVTLNFAVFADLRPNAPPSMAHAAIARFEDPARWRFLPSADSLEAFSASRTKLDGMDFVVQLLRTPAADDWTGGLWRDGGYAVPEYWLVKRWVAHLDDAARAVMEYREPWPDCLPEFLPGVVMVSESAYQCLNEFVTRADAAFLVERKGGDFKSGEAPSGSALTGANPSPDLQKIMGGIVFSTGTGGGA